MVRIAVATGLLIALLPVGVEHFQRGQRNTSTAIAAGTTFTRRRQQFRFEACRPAWSPKGNEIAFDANWRGTFSVYVADTNGNHIRRVPDDSVWSGHPAWSPDASEIAFARGPEGHRHLFIMRADGSQLRQITDGLGNDHFPAWSSDGTTLAFNSDRNGKREIFTVRRDGSQLSRLTHNDSQNDEPEWAPRDTAIIYDSDRGGSWNIWVMRPDGSADQKLHAGAAPSFSHDGGRIVFQDTPAKGIVSLFVMNADGTEVARVTSTNALDFVPTFSPDGRQIVFCSNRDGTREVYRMHADGTSQTRLTFAAHY